MPCYHPIPASIEYGQGKKQMRLHPKGEPSHWLPCGKCLGCREIQQQQLALRVTHEAKHHENKHFLTLTYSDDKLPESGGLVKSDMQKFWKRIRRRTAAKIKHLTCGEYGDRTQRAHYHAAVLGLPLNDLKNWDSENKTSEILTETWGNGIVTVSELTEDRINYVAGYVLKKAGYRRQIYCNEDGEELQPPYRDMSKGLGKTWIQKYQTDLRNGYVEHRGAKQSIPRYYKDYISKNNEQLDSYIEQKKYENAKIMTGEILHTLHNAEKIRTRQIKELRRDKI